MSPTPFVLAILLLLVNFYFVMIEFALVASRTARLEVALDNGDRRAVAALRAVRDLPRGMGTAQVGITIASLALGLVGEPAVARLLRPVIELFGSPSHGVVHTIAFILALGAISFFHLVMAEMVPRNLSLAAPERWLLTLAPIHRFVMRILAPLVFVLNAMSTGLLRLVRLRPATEVITAHTAAELSLLLETSREEGQIEPFEHSLLTGALDFGDRPASALMVPRERVVSVTRRMTVAAVEQVARESGHSRLLVVGAAGEVLGFVHVKDLLRLPPEAAEDPLPLETIRRLLVLRPDRRLEDVLRVMRRRRSHFGLVQERTAIPLGIVTLEDVLEALVGDITDETDPAGYPAVRLPGSNVS